MRLFWLALAALLIPAGAQAQSDYPNKPVRLIVDSAAGSANDATARILADKPVSYTHLTLPTIYSV